MKDVVVAMVRGAVVEEGEEEEEVRGAGVVMDDGEVDSRDSEGLPDLHFLDDSIFIQGDWDNLMRTTQVCSHKHICNPTTGPDNTHTHTCEHTHTHTISSGDEEKLTKKKRPSGNKEAVRKYREKQKAVKVNLEVKNAELLKENLRLRRRVLDQGPTQAALNQSSLENKRLKTLLLHVRRLIDTELDALNSQKQPVTPSRVDGCRSGSVQVPHQIQFSAGVSCASPLPCPSLPASQTGLTDLDYMGSVGWHTECEQINTVCHEPEWDAHVTRQCTAFQVEGSTKAACRSLPAVSNQKVTVSSTKARRPSSSLHPIAYHADGVPCAAPVPCLNGRRVVNQAEGMESLSWQGGCELMNGDMCQDTEMTADSSAHCTALGPEVTPSATAASRKESLRLIGEDLDNFVVAARPIRAYAVART